MNFSDIKGLEFSEVTLNDRRDEITWRCVDGRTFLMYHRQDCCEEVMVEDICGDLADLVGTPILFAEESSNENQTPAGIQEPDYSESYTWTFYRIGTARGTVVIRWLGESSGYYSESINFRQLT